MANWQTFLERWRAAGLIDGPTAARVQEWETRQGASRHDRLGQIAFALGGLALAAGVLLFVAAHWDSLSPLVRFLLVLLLVIVFHVSGAIVRPRSDALSLTFHAVGTAALGAGIFLAGQIFNMAEHWPGALMLWALGAAVALAMLRDWTHVLWVAILVPLWLFAEWIDLYGARYSWPDDAPLAGGLLLALVYLSARNDETDTVWRAALARLGAVAIVPVGIAFGFAASEHTALAPYREHWNLIGWIVALTLPGALAVYLRGRDALFLVAPILWVALLAWIANNSDAGILITHVMYALLSIGLVLWGLREQRRIMVDIGILGFALTIFFFYFASLFDKLGRSLGLIGMGVVFIGGGWLLERMRRRLIGSFDRRPS